MRLVRVAGLFALVGLAACSNSQPRGDVLVFDHVSVINVRDGATLGDQRVVISGNRITSVGSASQVSVPRNARVIDAQGQYLIPGLWDMHTHVIDPDSPGSPDVSLPLFVANGVTGIRDVGSSSLDSIVELRSTIRSGERVGPRMLISGKLIDGRPVVFPPNAVLARTAAVGSCGTTVPCCVRSWLEAGESPA